MIEVNMKNSPPQSYGEVNPEHANSYGEARKVVVAISGGVDSSVTAFLLKEKGYEVVGVYMRLKPEDGEAESAARAVCKKLNIKFYPVNLMSKFKKEIISYFLDSYKKGLTPNPCVKCNRLIKFGELLRIREEMGADYLATGHYITKYETQNMEHEKFTLHKGKDNTKDQSYFLYHLTQDKLKYILFPLGEMEKSRVRGIAKENDLPYLKKESQDICFLDNDHNIFLEKFIDSEKGEIRTLDDSVIGEHKGLAFYTIGQRRGVDIGGTGPYYVIRCDYKNNILYVSNNRDDKKIYTKEFTVRQVNWISGENVKDGFKCLAVIRYGHEGEKCKIQNVKCKNNDIKVIMRDAQRAVTPGQSVVFYDGDELLGGGIICNN